VVVLPLVPQTNIIGPLSLDESLLRMSGEILRAMPPGAEVLILPIILPSFVNTLQAMIANVSLKFIKIINSFLCGILKSNEFAVRIFSVQVFCRFL